METTTLTSAEAAAKSNLSKQCDPTKWQMTTGVDGHTVYWNTTGERASNDRDGNERLAVTIEGPRVQGIAAGTIILDHRGGLDRGPTLIKNDAITAQVLGNMAFQQLVTQHQLDRYDEARKSGDDKLAESLFIQAATPLDRAAREVSGRAEVSKDLKRLLKR